MDKNIAIIPARSGSKAVIDKNIKMLNGKPLIAYTIQAAIDSNMFDMIIVSTDSARYADIARQYGASVPFLRSKENASDQASSWEVVKEVLFKLESQEMMFETFALLQPTSPLRDGEDIRKAYKVLFEREATSVVSVCEAEHSPLWCDKLPENHCLDDFLCSSEGKRRQDLETYYRLNGAIYISKVDEFLKGNSLYGKNGYAVIMDRYKSIDIDDTLDFIIAEAIMKSQYNRK